jgi:predicted negative regulator of RcsB-dependent stress response
MTKAKTPAAAAVAAVDEFDVATVMDHLITRKRELAIGAIVVVVIAGGLLLWRLSVNQKNDRAEQALTLSTNALYAGNRPLAATELQQVADRYRDTAPGVEGAMILAQLDFEDARWADGLKVLEAIQNSSQIGNFKAPVDGLMAGAYADLKKYDEAIKHYQAASDESVYPSIKDVYQADAARMMGLAGKKDDAKKIWEALAAKTESPSVAEAKVRLGELEAAAATKN